MSPVRVLYLAGSGRSGSTLVTTILGQLDGMFAAGELRYLWQRGIAENRPCGCGVPVPECPFWTRVLATLPPTDAGGIAARLRTRLRLRGLPALLWRHRRGRPPVPRHPDDDILATLYAAVGTATGAVVVDSSKLPPYGALLGTLPGIELRVLHLVRDPRATAFSWRRRRRLDVPVGGGGDGRLMARPPVAKATLLWLVWNAATRLLWGARHPERYLRVRYEDLVADPPGVIARIARFAGVEPAELPFPAPGVVRLAATHSVAGNPSRHRIGVLPVRADREWVTGLSRAAYALVTLLTLPALRRLGYPVRRPGRRSRRDPRPGPRTVPEEG